MLYVLARHKVENDEKCNKNDDTVSFYNCKIEIKVSQFKHSKTKLILINLVACMPIEFVNGGIQNIPFRVRFDDILKSYIYKNFDIFVLPSGRSLDASFSIMAKHVGSKILSD